MVAPAKQDKPAETPSSRFETNFFRHPAVAGPCHGSRSIGDDDLDSIARSIAHAMSSDVAIVTGHDISSPTTSLIMSAVGQALPHDVLQHIADTAAIGTARRITKVAGWHILHIAINSIDERALVLSLGSRASIWSPGALSHPTLELLRPLIDASFGAWERSQVAQRKQTGLACALDGVDLGILLLDRSGNVTFANRAGRDILDDATYLRKAGKRVAGIGLREALALQVAIEHVITANGQGKGSRHAPVLALRSATTGLSVIVSIVPVIARASMPDEVAAVMYVLDPRIDTTKQLQPVCGLYNLSPVEARLACLLTAGASLQEAAEAMRIKEQTARSYLKQIFLKTDTNRQADLVRVLLTSVLRTQCEIDPVLLR